MNDNQDTARLIAEFTKRKRHEREEWQVLEPRFLDGLADLWEHLSDAIGNGAEYAESESWDSTELRSSELVAHQGAEFLRHIANEWRRGGTEAVVPTTPQY